MAKSIFSYGFFYYSFYRYFSKNHFLARGWPEGWAVIGLSIILGFSINILRFFFIVFDVQVIELFFRLEFVANLPVFVRATWSYWVILFLNIYIFLFNDYGVYAKEKYNSYPKDTLSRYCLMVKVIVVLVVCLYIYLAYLVSKNI